MGTILLLLVLAGLWIGVGAWWLSGRQSDRPVDSIGSFRRQLGTLERRTPTLVAPANRMRAPGARFNGPQMMGDRPGMGRAIATARSTPVSAYRRQAAQKRRRDVFFGLILGAALTLLGGFVPTLRLLWVLCAMDLALLGAYCALLVRMRGIAAEREMKVHYLPRAVPERLYAVSPANALLRRSAN